jgi:hypothetical protein
MKYTQRGSGPSPRRTLWRCKVQGNPARPPGIEGVEMRTSYYNPMRNSVIAVPCLIALAFSTQLLASPQQAPLKAASLESHEGLTISARPWTEPAQYKQKFPKKSPYGAGIVAVEVSFRNDSDDSLKVSLEQLRLNLTLSEENRQGLQALKSDELADAVLHPKAKDPTAQRSRLPLPIPRSQGGRDKNWTELQRAADDAGVPTSIIAAHKTVTGLLYFDLQGQFDLLNSARLYVPTIIAMDKNRALTYFDIDLGHH